MVDQTWLIEANITRMWNSFVEAINNRDFNPDSPAWQNLAHDFIHESDSPGPERRDIRLKDRSPAEYLESLQKLTTRCPNYRLHVKNTCVSVYPKASWAEAAFDMDVYGLFQDVIRPHVSHVEFRHREGRWVCTLIEVVSGQAIADGTTGELSWPPRIDERTDSPIEVAVSFKEEERTTSTALLHHRHSSLPPSSRQRLMPPQLNMTLIRNIILALATLFIVKCLTEGASLCLHFPHGDSYCFSLTHTKTNITALYDTRPF
ncbi:hypothetical protein PRZ48_002736 [Zasmidium cellare]|uniref:Uncharacterized protein n=1 Tax=Zasmidium cellare TaxID=395010 RepID=A0ABR0ET22_ZASCE|nr:hypothetical protein PRZ48_002736 [Zasmidium cellare]